MRLPAKPPHSPKHTEERIKFFATGLQNFALALSLGVLVLPSFTGASMVSLTGQLSAFFIAGLAESLAFVLLRYIPSPAAP